MHIPLNTSISTYLCFIIVTFIWCLRYLANCLYKKRHMLGIQTTYAKVIITPNSICPHFYKLFKSMSVDLSINHKKDELF